MSRGARSAPIFFDHECCALFHDLLGELPERYNIVVHAYALMPNHFHILLQTPNANLSRAMSHLLGRYASELNRKYEWDGPLFKGRFKNKVVENSEYWRHLLAYVHLNPVRGGLVTRLNESDWTSHAAYVGLERPQEWLHRDEMLEAYGTPEAYYEYLQAVQCGRQQSPDGFERAALWKKRSTKRSKTSRAVELSGSTEERFESAVAELQTVTRLSRKKLLFAPRGRTGNRVRWVTAWWLRWRDRMTGREVATYLGVSQSRISQMVTRAREAEEVDAHFATWMQVLREGRNPTGSKS